MPTRRELAAERARDEQELAILHKLGAQLHLETLREQSHARQGIERMPAAAQALQNVLRQSRAMGMLEEAPSRRGAVKLRPHERDQGFELGR